MARTTEEKRRYNEEVGSRVREERERAGVTQKQLERLTGILQPTLSALEKGARQGATSEQIAKIAAALRIPTDRLLQPKLQVSTPAPEVISTQMSVRDRKLGASREAFLAKFAAELAPADRQCIETVVFLTEAGPGFDPDDQYWWDLVEVGRRRRERARSRGVGG